MKTHGPGFGLASGCSLCVEVVCRTEQIQLKEEKREENGKKKRGKGKAKGKGKGKKDNSKSHANKSKLGKLRRLTSKTKVSEEPDSSMTSKGKKRKVSKNKRVKEADETNQAEDEVEQPAVVKPKKTARKDSKGGVRKVNKAKKETCKKKTGKTSKTETKNVKTRDGKKKQTPKEKKPVAAEMADEPDTSVHEEASSLLISSVHVSSDNTIQYDAQFLSMMC